MSFIRKPIRLKILLAIFAILCATFIYRAAFYVPAAGAAPATRPSSTLAAEQSQKLVTRTYDVHAAITFPKGTTASREKISLGSSWDGIEPSAPEDPDLLLHALIGWIHEAVAPDSWNASTPIHISKESLIVTQTPEVHKELARFLEKWEARIHASVHLQAQFLSLDSATMAQLTPQLRQKVEAMLTGGSFQGGFLNPEETKALTDAARMDYWTKSTAMRIFNGRWSYTLRGTQRTYVAGWRLKQGKDGHVEYEPKITNASYGALLEVMPTLGQTPRIVTLSVHAELQRLQKLEVVKLGQAADGREFSIQHPFVDRRVLDTTISMPPGRGTLLLSGFKSISPESLEKSPAAQNSTSGDFADRVILLVQVI